MNDREIGLSTAETARRNGWGVGTRLAGDEGYGETVIEVTAVGKNQVLARAVSHRGEAVAGFESMWTFSCRDWRVVSAPSYRVVQHPTRSLDQVEAIHDGHVDEEGS